MSGERPRRLTAQRRDIDAGDGLHLHVVSSGEGPPLLLLHGFTGSAETWAPVREALFDRFTLHAVELPGHGRSGAPKDARRYALSRLSTDLALVMDGLDVQRTAVLGYSLGGRAALRFALDHPARVEALVLESASPGIADASERAQRAQADNALADAIERDGVAAFVERWERLPLWASQAALPEAARAHLRAQRLANRAGGLANSLRGSGAAVDEPVLERLASVAAPTLVLAGALDAKYLALGRLMVDALPRARLRTVEGAGHAVHLERPDEYAMIVAEFLESLR